MKVLFVSAVQVGGAGRAALRLAASLREGGVDASLLVQHREGEEPHVLGPETAVERLVARAAPLLEAAWVRWREPRCDAIYSPAVLPDLLARRVAELQPDVVHLHWVGYAMLRIETLRRLGRPIVWTMHDAWPFSGGCHVPFDFAAARACTRSDERCGRCPALGSSRDRDLSRRVWERKQRAWEGLELAAVAPSRWLAERARASSLFRERRVEHVPNGLDLARFAPADRRSARRLLRLPEDGELIAYGAMSAAGDPNKGFRLLAAALRALPGRRGRDGTHLVTFGSGAAPAAGELPYPTTCAGWLRDDVSLRLLYSAADVVVVPSFLENLPFAAMEAMACGTPVVAFRQGGMPELVDHQETGYLARPYEPEDLAEGIAWVLAERPRREQLGAAARAKAEATFDLRRTAARYLELYRELGAGA